MTTFGPQENDLYNRTLSAVEEGMRGGEAKRPATLFHYTRQQGFQGIVRSQVIWASDAGYLNDSTEMVYTNELIQRIIADEFRKAGHSELADLVEAKDALTTAREGIRPFIACFCEKGDLLSQWRGYGGGGPAYAMEFESRIFDSIGNMRKVVYDPAEQERILRLFATTLLAANQQSHEQIGLQGAVSPAPALRVLRALLEKHYFCFKHPTFEEEQEWRVVYPLDPAKAARPGRSGMKIHFRESIVGMVPYVELRQAIPIVPPPKFPLKSVTHGPTMHPELARHALRVFLDTEGYDATEVRSSGVPLRA